MKSVLESLLKLGEVMSNEGCKEGFSLNLPMPAFRALVREVEKMRQPASSSQPEARERALHGDGLASLQLGTAAGTAIVFPLRRL